MNASALPLPSNTLDPVVSEGFARDLLTDAYGVSFHRFQIVIWAAVLGLVFLHSVWARAVHARLLRHAARAVGDKHRHLFGVENSGDPRLRRPSGESEASAV